ncbi:MAG: hypothetical protein NTY53_09390 [Kiritimatiellaeota bacterium]|nr:hypothetical protein [Kiritimatiellota bacterium]
MKKNSLLLSGLLLCAALLAERGHAQTATAPDRKLVLRVKMDGFGGASEADIKAVLRSAGSEIWEHCPNTQFAPQGFEIYHNSKYPITHYEPSKEGCIVIGLAVEGNLWARFSFQFAHEFTHALMDHSNDPGRLWHKLEHANQWLEESICETASLFSLRAMAKTWQTKPPYGNWKSYAPSLADYAAQRMNDPKHQLPAGQTFAAWFAVEEPGLRKQWAQREKNTLIAQQLLPLFEAEPSGWETVTALKLGTRDVNKTLAKHLAEWHANAPAAQRAFILKFAVVFGVNIQPLPK